MVALTADRNTARAERGFIKSLPMAAATKIFAGSMVCRTMTGAATKGATALSLVTVGRANEQIDNSSGAAGALRIKVEEGIFVWANSSAADQITDADIGNRCFVVDDQTVARTSGSGTRSPAGVVVAVDTTGVWVMMGDDILTVGNQLVPLRIDTLVAAGTYFVTCPFPGRVSRVWSVVQGALATGSATLQARINAVNITGGLVTHPSTAVAGDQLVVDPTALNTVAQGDKLSVVVGGTNANAVVANMFFEIERR